MAMNYNSDSQYNNMFSDPRYKQYIDELYSSMDAQHAQQIIQKLQELANEYDYADENDAIETTEHPQQLGSTAFTSQESRDIDDYMGMGYQDTVFESPQSEQIYAQQEQSQLQQDNISQQVIVTPLTFDKDRSIQYAKAILDNTLTTDNIIFQNNRGEQIHEDEWANGILSTYETSQEEAPDVQTYLVKELIVGAYNDKPIYAQRMRFYAGDIMYTIDLETGDTSQLYDSRHEGQPYETMIVEGQTTNRPRNKHIEFAEGNVVIMNGNVYWVESTPQILSQENEKARTLGGILRTGERIKDNVGFLRQTIGVVDREENNLKQLKRELESAKQHKAQTPSVQNYDHVERLKEEIKQAKARVRKAKLNRITSIGRTLKSPFSKDVIIPEVERAYNKIQTADPIYLEYTATPGYHPQFTRPQVAKARHQVRARAPKAK